MIPPPGQPILVIGIGNRERGDDALGTLVAEKLKDNAPADIEILSDQQLRIEHTLDLCHRRKVIFADASVATPLHSPFRRSHRSGTSATVRMP